MLLRQVKTWILRGWPNQLGPEQQCLQPYFTRRYELTVSKGLIYWGHRVVLPETERVPILRELHDTHPGMTAMKRLARTMFWYPGLDHDIEKLVQSCQQCVQCWPMPAEQVPSSWPKTNKRWSRLHIDYAGPVEGHMILVVVDAETKWIEAVPLKTASVETTVEVLRGIFARFGLPHTVVSDNGPQFNSSVTERFFKDNHVCHVTSAPYYPQSNGLAERAVRTIKEGIKKNKDGSLLNRISKFLLRYRATPTRDGKSPAEMLLGFQPRTRLSAHFPEEEVARDPTVSRPPAPLSQVFSPGAPVWSRQYNHAGQRWLPGTVTSTRGRRMVTVDTTGGVQRRHVDQVRPRLAADDVKQEFDATRPGDNQVTESDQPSAVDDAEPSSDGSLGTPQISSEVTSSVPAGLELPRRSTRTRRPPDRLGF
ncbi:uncharacterized protein K02A2.6-like [Dermacentor silvarum]|uniref:uncharacterized protein K02A2.6-like n=1 Tax=Dermacentor silvarum TaxID=543639 RepID=UPI00210123EA|nr:uncharacterized protein K02A2.6-like [Dermacentor silvarum]